MKALLSSRRNVGMVAKATKNKNKNMKNMNNNKNIYKIKDLVSALDRDKTTILRWEKDGVIPRAKRDSRGWRYYTADEFDSIVNKIKDTRHFNGKLAIMAASLIFAINILAVFTLSRIAFGNSNMNANLNVTAGNLNVYASSTVTAFGSVAYGYTAQTSSATNVGAVGISDKRGGPGNWTFALSCSSSSFDCMWKGSTELTRFSQHIGVGSGGTPSSTGALCTNLANNRCVSTAGESCTGTVTTQTGYNCFNSAKADITFATGADAHGDYWFAETDWDQTVPAYTTASLYTTTLIWSAT